MALSVYITTSRSHRLSVMYLVCFMRTTWLTSDANDFVNAKSHAEDRNSARTVPHPFLSNIIDPRFGFFMFWKGSLSKIRWHLPRRVLPTVDYKGYLFFPPCKGIQDSLGFWIPRHGLRIPGTGFIPCQWDLVFEFQSIMGFRITWAVFRIPESRIPDSTSKIFPDSGFQKQKFIGFRNPDSLTCWREAIFHCFHTPGKWKGRDCARLAHKSSFWARSAIVRGPSVKRERASESSFVPGPTTPAQKTMRTTLRKSRIAPV